MSQAIHTNTVPRWLPAKTKISIALDAIGGMKISHTAQKHGVCRNSVYAQQGKAKQAIHNAFEGQNNGMVQNQGVLLNTWRASPCHRSSITIDLTKINWC